MTEIITVLFVGLFWGAMLSEFINLKTLLVKIVVFTIFSILVFIFFKINFFQSISYGVLVILILLTNIAFAYNDFIKFFVNFFKSREMKILDSILDDLDFSYSEKIGYSVFSNLIKPMINDRIKERGQIEIFKMLNDKKWTIREFLYLEISDICEYVIINIDSYKYSLKFNVNLDSTRDIYDDMMSELVKFGTISKKHMKQRQKEVEFRRNELERNLGNY